MTSGMIRVFALALAATLAWPLGAQESQPAATTMPSDAELHTALDALLATLGVHELDPGVDGLEQAEARAKALRLVIQKYSEEIRKRAVDNAAIAELPRDAVSLHNDASPRLSGRVLHVGAGGEFKDLASVVSNMRRGDLIVLGEGVFDFVDSRVVTKWENIALVGIGVNQTTLKIPRGGEIRECTRLRIEGVRIDCLGDPLTSVHAGTGFMLKNCELMNYNSGAGGSNALYSQTGVVWLDGCLFDGAKGRAGGRGSFGDALDIRGATVFARHCQFVDNDEIDRATDMRFFDRCTMLNSKPGSGVIPYSGTIWMRDSDSLITPRFGGGKTIKPFAHTTDDIEFIDFVLDQSKPIDDDSKKLAHSLQMHRRLPYWIGLIHHDDARVRELAAKKVHELTGEEVRLPKEQPREGERLADAGVLLQIEVEYARLMNWFDANRAKLTWDEAAQRYRVGERPPEQPK
jgi:hypothetical protein